MPEWYKFGALAYMLSQPRHFPLLAVCKVIYRGWDPSYPILTEGRRLADWLQLLLCKRYAVVFDDASGLQMPCT